MTTDIIEDQDQCQDTMDILDTLLKLIRYQQPILLITMLRTMQPKKMLHTERQINRFTISGLLLNRGESMSYKGFKDLIDFQKSGEMHKRESMHLLPDKIQLRTIIKELEHLHMLRDGDKHTSRRRKKLMLMLKLLHSKQVMMRDFIPVLLRVSSLVGFFCC